MEQTETKLFEALDHSVALIRNKTKSSYLDALIESGENLIDITNSNTRQENDESQSSLEGLNDVYQSIQLKEYQPETIRKALQLLILKGMREDQVQPNHQMTPDSIGTLVGYLIKLMVPDDSSVHITDLSIGTGNLVYTIYHFMMSHYDAVQLSGVDNDELLISLCSMSGALQNVPIELFLQDSSQHLLIEPADIVVGDLPVGYYPIDEIAQRYDTAREEGHSYTHHLLIEQGLHYVQEGGYGFFVVPSQLFNEVEGKRLLTYIQKVGHLQGIIQLPTSLFKNENSQKSIVMIQKQSTTSVQAQQVLLATAPSFSKPDDMRTFLNQLAKWKHENLSS